MSNTLIRTVSIQGEAPCGGSGLPPPLGLLPLPSGLLTHGGRIEEGGTNTYRDTATRPPPPPPIVPAFVILVRRHGNPRPLAERPPTMPLAPAATPAPPPNALQPLPCLLSAPETTDLPRPAPPARSTSKCRKMSQNVALFHTPTRRMSDFTSKKPHVFGQNRAVLAISRSIPRPPAIRATTYGPPRHSAHGGQRVR